MGQSSCGRHLDCLKNVYGKVPPVAMTAILTSDTDGACTDRVYADLHDYDPDSSFISLGQKNLTFACEVLRAYFPGLEVR